MNKSYPLASTVASFLTLISNFARILSRQESSVSKRFFHNVYSQTHPL